MLPLTKRDIALISSALELAVGEYKSYEELNLEETILMQDWQELLDRLDVASVEGETIH